MNTNLYIDCEWDGYLGDLISMALVSDDGREFYEVLECIKPTPWAASNVMPVLNRSPVALSTLQEKLAAYLQQFPSVTVIADWPEDIARFCTTLITGPGTRIDTPSLTMAVYRVDTVSKTPHNALADARALRDYFITLEGPHG
jgi:hypothetical protein